MQQPTLQRVRIRHILDAHKVFNAVLREELPLITRRLDAEERRNIVPGNVYVWEERASSSETTGLGMERWTDGMGWGPSRVRDEFLFYHQKDSDVDSGASASPWGDTMRRRSDRPYLSTRRIFQFPRPTVDAERLIKQTYSVTVNVPSDDPSTRPTPRKWHLTAYYSQQELESLRTVDDIRGVGDVVVPQGWFKSARAGKSKREQRDTQGNASSHGRNNRACKLGGTGSDNNNDEDEDSGAVSITLGNAQDRTLGAPDHHYQSLFDAPTVHHARRPHCPTPRLRMCSDYNRPSPSASSSGTSGRLSRASTGPPSEHRRTSPGPYKLHPLHPPHSTATDGPGTMAMAGTAGAPPSEAPLFNQLVPLEYLQNVTMPRREPIDEQQLSMFSADVVPAALHGPSTFVRAAVTRSRATSPDVSGCACDETLICVHQRRTGLETIFSGKKRAIR